MVDGSFRVDVKFFVSVELLVSGKEAGADDVVVPSGFVDVDVVWEFFVVRVGLVFWELGDDRVVRS